MNRRKFVITTGVISGLSLVSSPLLAMSKSIKIHFLRHATFVLEIGGVRLLIDPMLSAKAAMDPVKITRNDFRIPLVDLPVNDEELTSLLATLDAVMITHTHRDHWDERARQLINKEMTIIGQPSDVPTLRQQGFGNILPVNTHIDFKELKIYRTGGQHGTGEVGLKMGPVSGFVVEYKTEKVYIAGDTIWCTEVEQALATHKPSLIVLNAGAAQFDQGDPITMTAQDVVTVARKMPLAKLVAVHMETVNHCVLTRNDLRKVLEENKLTKQVIIPKDGERL